MAEDPNTFMLFLRLALSFATVLALVGALTWVLRRRGMLGIGGGADRGRLEVLERKSLGKSSALVLARVGDRAVLLGVTGERIEMLCEAPDPDAPALEGAAALMAEPAPRPTALTVPAARTRPMHMTGGARRTGHPVADTSAGPTRMSFIEALQELTVRRS